ncbi:MAG: hypothetical protein M1825_002179 [Sarcosagium campestre]|nr:MAG: hypothetical protein M1825_002179 [Sarcosagium campestre]
MSSLHDTSSNDTSSSDTSSNVSDWDARAEDLVAYDLPPPPAMNDPRLVAVPRARVVAKAGSGGSPTQIWEKVSAWLGFSRLGDSASRLSSQYKQSQSACSWPSPSTGSLGSSSACPSYTAVNGAQSASGGAQAQSSGIGLGDAGRLLQRQRPRPPPMRQASPAHRSDDPPTAPHADN